MKQVYEILHQRHNFKSQNPCVMQLFVQPWDDTSINHSSNQSINQLTLFQRGLQQTVKTDKCAVPLLCVISVCIITIKFIFIVI